MDKASLIVPFGKIQMEFIEDTVWFHAQADKWSPSIYKESLDSWLAIIEFCKVNGYKYIASHIPDDNKIRKFQTLFGLEPYAETEHGLVFRMEI